MLTYFEEIMVDTLGNRAGFSCEVVVELGSLKHHYNRVLFPIKIDVGKNLGENGLRRLIYVSH